MILVSRGSGVLGTFQLSPAVVFESGSDVTAAYTLFFDELSAATQHSRGDVRKGIVMRSRDSVSGEKHQACPCDNRHTGPLALSRHRDETGKRLGRAAAYTGQT